MVDASFVNVPKQRNSKDDNDTIKQQAELVLAANDEQEILEILSKGELCINRGD